MKICIYSSENALHDCEPVGPSVHLKYPRVFTVFAESFLCDPRLIAALGKVPEVVQLRPGYKKSMLSGADLVIAPHRMAAEDEASLLEYLAAGGRAFWVRPSACALKRATSGQMTLKRTLHSLRERWFLPGGAYFYAQMLNFDIYENAPEGLYPIGEAPSVTRVSDSLTVCGGDLFLGYMWYLNSPADILDDSGFANAFQSMFIAEIARLLAVPPKEGHTFFLRRDFHAYGYTRRMVEDLFGLHGQTPDFAAADAALKTAAEAYAQGEEGAAIEAALRPAFVALKAQRDRITDIPVYYADGMHGGILTEDYGYIEIASPQFVSELFRMFLAFARRRGYHFSCDVSIATFVHMQKRFPHFIQDLKKAMEEGIFEAANGSIGQLYPHLFGLETNIRQFVSGQNAMETLFGRRAVSFLAQEMQFTPTYASILKQSGYKGALHRIQNKGATVYDDQVCVTWRAPGGDELKCIPTHYDDSQQVIATGFALWPELITETAKHQNMGIYTNLLDIVWITLFREETIRASWYAPVMGEFVTYSELYDRLTPTATRTYTREDYLPEMQPGTSKMLRDMGMIGRTLEATEKYAACSRRGDLAEVLREAWDALGEFVNHDNTVCFHVRPTDQSYLPFACGPDRRGPELYDVLESMTHRRLQAVKDALGAAEKWFNPLASSRNVPMALTDGGWEPLKRIANPASLRAAEVVSISALSTRGMAALPTQRARVDSVAQIDNGILRARLDMRTGALSSLCVRGRELLRGDGGRIAAGMEGGSTLVSFARHSIGAVQCLYVETELRYPDGRDGGRALTCMTLVEGESILRFTTRVVPSPQARVLYRTYPHDRADGIGVVFNLPRGYNRVRDCWMHAVHPAFDGKDREYGPGLYYGNRTLEREYLSLDKGHITQSALGLVLEGDGLPTLLLHNDGSTIYEVQDGTVRNLLWCGYEYGDTFSYALEPLERDAFEAMLDYQYDLLPVPGGEIQDAPRVEHAWLSAMIREDGATIYRLVETLGETVDAVLRVPARGAVRVNLLGDEMEKVPDGDRIVVPLMPHGIASVRVPD